MNTPDQVYTLLRAALLKARADGLEIVCDKFGDGKTCCCAVTAYTGPIPEQIESIGNELEWAADKLSVLENDVEYLTCGFDACRYGRGNPFYAVGQKLRDEFIEEKGEA